MPALYASQIGTLAAQALSSDEEAIIGEVIAIFPNSFYLKTRGDQLLFFTNRSLRSPITVNLAYSGSFRKIIRPLESLYLYDRRLCNSSLSIDLTQTPLPTKEDALVDKNPDFVNLAEAANILSTILNVIETAGSVLDLDQPTVHDSVADFVKQGILPLRTKENHSEFAAAASRIIGLGTGFTPSGDDFLLGFLVVYNSLVHVIARTPIYMEFDQLARRNELDQCEASRLRTAPTSRRPVAAPDSVYVK